MWIILPCGTTLTVVSGLWSLGQNFLMQLRFNFQQTCVSQQCFSLPVTPIAPPSSLLDTAQDTGVFLSPDPFPMESVADERAADCVFLRSATNNYPSPRVSGDYQHHIRRFLNSHALHSMKREPDAVFDSSVPVLAPENFEPVVNFSPVVHSAGSGAAVDGALPVVVVSSTIGGASVVAGSTVIPAVARSSVSRPSAVGSPEVPEVLLLPDAGLVCPSPPGIIPMPVLPGGHSSVLLASAASADLSPLDAEGLLDPCFRDAPPLFKECLTALFDIEDCEVVVPADALRFFQPSSLHSLELSASSMLAGSMSFQ